jgi:hypothetical protein
VLALVYRKKGKRFSALFGCVWIFTVYLFYVGMDICRLKFFLVVLAPCMLLVFAGADRIDAGLRRKGGLPPHAAKIAALLFLIFLSLGPSVSELTYIRGSNDSEATARGIGGVVGTELLFTSSMMPMINYYNRANPPETVYLITELKPGTIKIDAEALNLARQRLRHGRPVFAGGIIIDNLKALNIDFDSEQVWRYKSYRLFRLTRLNVVGMEGLQY